MKRTSLALLVVVATMLWSAVVAAGSSSSNVVSNASVAPQEVEADTTELVIHGVNDEFSPQVLTVVSGTTYHLLLINDDEDEHDWEVDGVGMTQSCIGPCQRDVTFTAPAPGQYKFYCIVHVDMGGTLFVK